MASRGPWDTSKSDAFDFALSRAYPNTSIKEIIRDKNRYQKIKAHWVSKEAYPNVRAVNSHLRTLAGKEGQGEEKAVRFGKPSNPTCTNVVKNSLAMTQRH